jgi:adenine phosphoribosyltransferase
LLGLSFHHVFDTIRHLFGQPAKGALPVDLASLIRDVPDFPIKGILFKDLTTLLKNADAFREAVDALAKPYLGTKIDLVAAIESRGFIFAAPVAYELGAGFVPIRKPGKLPAETISVEYALEYGTNTLEIHRDAIQPGQRVLLIDDLLATGGSAAAAVQLIERLGGQVVGIAFLVNLTFLKGLGNLAGYETYSVIDF